MTDREKTKVKAKVVPVLNQAPRPEDVVGEWRYSPTHPQPRTRRKYKKPL